MKRILAIAAVLPAFPLLAQTHLLTGRVSSDNIDRTDWVYNDKNKVTEIHNSDITHPEWNSIRLITWNEEGLQTGEQLYQDIDMAGTGDYNDYRWNGILQFVYDESNHIVERIVFNNVAARGVAEPDFQVAGIIAYDYDEEGRLILAATYFDQEKTNLYQKIEYKYDEDGYLREAETWMLNWFTNEIQLNSRESYTYLADGRLSRISVDEADVDQGNLYYSSATVYNYDEDGRLMSKEIQNAAGTVQTKYVFNYGENPIAAENMVFPYNEDDVTDNELWRQFDCMPESYDDWAMDQSTSILTYLVTYDYVVSELAGVGVGRVVSEDVRRGPVAMSFTDGVLVLGNVEPGTMVSVYSADGKRVAQSRYSRGGMELSGIPSGTYVVSTPAGAVKVWK